MLKSSMEGRRCKKHILLLDLWENRLTLVEIRPSAHRRLVAMLLLPHTSLPDFYSFLMAPPC